MPISGGNTSAALPEYEWREGAMKAQTGVRALCGPVFFFRGSGGGSIHTIGVPPSRSCEEGGLRAKKNEDFLRVAAWVRAYVDCA
jgi:hypothetical protein